MNIELEVGPTAALHEALARIGDRSTAGFRRDLARGVTAYSTATPMRSMNGVTVDARREDDVAAAITSARAAMRGTDAPWTIQVHGHPGDVAEVLPTTGFAVLDVAKTWVADLGAVPEVPTIDTLTITTVTDDADRLGFADVLGRAFGTGRELGLPLVDASVLADPDIVAYVGREGDVPLVTGMAVFDRAWTGVFAIATDAEHRRRGLGAAMMSRIIHDGLDRGAHSAYLQASDLGLSLYRRLGFVDAHDDTTYIAAQD